MTETTHSWFEHATVAGDTMAHFNTTLATNEEISLGEQAFQYCVVIVGMVGASANGTVFVVLVTQSKLANLSNSTKFILNQLACDLVSCLSLVLVYGWKVANTQQHTKWSYWSCYLVGSEIFLWSAVSSSTVNLSSITLERYVKIVHNSFHQKYYRDWMTYVIIASTWIIGFGITFPVDYVTIDFDPDLDTCDGFTKWADETAGLGYSVFLFVFVYACPLLIFVLCYWRIVVAIRQSASSFVNTNRNLEAMHQKNRVAIVKTMIIITVVFGLCWSPNEILFILVTLNAQASEALTVTSSAWYVCMFIGFLTASVNPFIYGARVETVRNFIQGLLRKLKSHGNIEISTDQVTVEAKY